MQNKVPDGVLRCLKGLETAYSNYIDPFRLTLQIRTFALDPRQGPEIWLKNGQKSRFSPKIAFLGDFLGLNDVFHLFSGLCSLQGICIFFGTPFTSQDQKIGLGESPT